MRPNKMLNENHKHGAIHITEIENTLIPIEEEFGINLRDNILGSVGKKKFSGDIDVALDIDAIDIPNFIESIKKSTTLEFIKKTSVIMTRAKIVGFNPDIRTDKLRTGFVQIDFMLGDPNWLKVFYHAPHEQDSKYNGAYRNILLGIIAKHTDPWRIGMPMAAAANRYKFSPRDGLVSICRLNDNNKEDIIFSSYKTERSIAKALSMPVEALDSFESLVALFKHKYSYRKSCQIALEFAQDSYVKTHGVPDELKEYLHEVNVDQ